jgi:hypothetical protein
MRKRIAIAAALASALFAVGLVALPAIGHRTAQPTHRLAAMSGLEESGAGDPNDYGAARVEILRRNVCFRILRRQVPTDQNDPAIVAHIHRGEPGVAGPIVVTLFVGDVPGGRRCVRTSRSLAREISRFPGRFYVNVHTAAFGDGAVRGQLTR